MSALVVATVVLGWLGVAAAPQSGFSTAQPLPNFTATARPVPAVPAPDGFTEAPRPNQDARVPRGTAATGPVSPELFTRRNQYRGEGITPESSSQTFQDRRAKPGAGVSLSVPLQ